MLIWAVIDLLQTYRAKSVDSNERMTRQTWCFFFLLRSFVNTMRTDIFLYWSSHGLIYTLLNFHVCFFSLLFFLSLCIYVTCLHSHHLLHTPPFFRSFFPGVWVPGRLDVPGQYRRFPASHPNHPFFQHCTIWEANPDACILVSYSCNMDGNSSEHRGR